MDFNDPHIRKLMSQEDQPLPPGLEWDAMESGIKSKMDEIQSEEKDKKRRYFIWFFLFAVLGTSSILMSYSRLMADGKEAAVAIEESNQTSPSDILTGDEKSEYPSSDVTRQLPLETEEIITDNKPINTNANENTNPNLKLDVSSQELVQDIKNTDKEISGTTEANIATVIDSRPKTIIAIEKEDSNVKPIEEQKQNEIKDILPPAQDELITHDYLEAIPSLETDMSNEEIPTHSLTSIDVLNHGMNGEVRFSTGLLVWNWGYGKNKPERKGYELSDLSYFTQLSYTHRFRKGFNLMVGLQYQQLESQLEWAEKQNNHTVTLENTVLEIRTDALTGQQTFITGDTEVEVEAYRVVRHHNTTRLYQIPLALGKTFEFGKWSTDIYAGGTFNFAAQHQGRTLLNGDVIDINGRSNPILDGRFAVGTMLSGQITYQLNPKLGLGAGIQMQKSITDWSKDDNVNIRPHSIGLELGLRYRL